MKKNLLLSTFLLLSIISSAQKFEWADYEVTNSLSRQTALATDASGNIFSSGIFNSTCIIQGDTITAPYGATDCILVKYDSSGNYLWAKVFGSGFYDEIEKVAVDVYGHVYVSCFVQTATTMMNDTTYTNITGSQLIQFDNDGNFIRTLFTNEGAEIAALGGSVYSAHGSTVEKLDTNLVTVWSRSTVPAGALTFSPFGFNRGDLYVTPGGRLVVCGAEQGGGGGTATFDTITLNFTSGAGVNEVFVISMDTSGSASWAKVLYPSSAQAESTFGAGGDDAGNVYMTLFTSGPLFFGNDSLFNPLGSPNFNAVLCYDNAGNEQWGRALYCSGGASDIYDVLVTDQNEILLGAYYEFGNAVFDQLSFSASGGAIVIKLDANGNAIWEKHDQVHSNATKNFNGLAMLSPGKYAATGFFTSVFQLGCFPPGPSSYGLFTTVISEDVEPVPITDFSMTQAGNTVLFKDLAQNATSFQWSFGDATTSTLSQPLHVYAQPGVYNACLTATNICGNSEKCDTIVVKGVRAIVTDRGSNDAVVTADIFGGGFTSNTTVLLKKSGSADIIPYFTTFINSGKLQVRLDLTAQIIGLWDVEVTVPADTVMTLVNGFTIDTASAYVFDITYGGPNASRPNRWNPSQITVHNKSNKDAAGVTVIYRLDQSWNSYLPASFVSPQQIPFLNSGYQYLVSNSLSTSLADHTFSDSVSSSAFGAFIIPLLRANSSYTLPLYVSGTVAGVYPKVTTAAATLLEPASLTGTYVPSPDICFSDFFKNAIERTFSISIAGAQWNACFPALFDSLRIMTSVQANDLNNYAVPFSLPASVVAMLSAMATSGCITGIPTVLTESEIKSVILKTLHNVVDSAELRIQIPVCSFFSGLRRATQALPAPAAFHSDNEAAAVIMSCGISGFGFAVYLAECPPVGLAVFFGVTIGCCIFATSVDPNQISGPGNNVDDVFQKPGEISAYTVAFENVATATAPAQVVMITDTLDVSRFDLNTFRFTSVTIGDSLKFEFDEPGFSQLRVSSLAPFNSDYLRTEATIDTSSGIIQWIFTTVDPVNYQPDTNVLAGFLPPNVNGTEGTGYVSYDVKLKSSLVTGDSIGNKATIVFDTNLPIATNDWLNVIDIDKPLSAVNALPPNINTTSFLVSWSGTDFIAGIRSYNIYVSENDAPYQLWLAATDTNQYTFNGVNGNKYEFISKAMDNAGNVEDPPLNPETNPDAVTTIITGMNEISGNLEFSLFPNPVSSELLVRSSEIIIEIRIYDVIGSKIFSLTENKTSSVKLETLHFPEGIYFVEISSNDRKGVSKFIKVD